MTVSRRANVAADPDFLLNTGTARILYHEFAENQPVYDYHNHLSVKDIAEHRRFSDLTELWLETDHYKWRAMRANGVTERYITGDADPYDKFLKWAWTVPRLIGNPLYHWTHLELSRYFGIDECLCPETAPEIWAQTKEMLQGEDFDTVSLLKKMNVKTLCTTDDPADELKYHRRIRGDKTINFSVRPSFRPDRYIGHKREAADVLCRKYDTADQKTALILSLDHFEDNGARVSDHGFPDFPYTTDPEFREIMDFLGAEYHRRGMVMQLHLGAMRNASPRLMSALGPDAGGDSVGRSADPYEIAAFLGNLEAAGSLPRTILYNLNPADNCALSTLAADFAPRVQFGAAWWLCDHYRGIVAQTDELMETGGFASSVGMLTDSRSFTSFVRHEYFRRIICRRIGELTESGMYPSDTDTLGNVVKDICYNNAVKFFEGGSK